MRSRKAGFKYRRLIPVRCSASAGPARPATQRPLRGRGLRVRPDDDRVADRQNLVGGHVDAIGVTPDRVLACALVDADGPELAVGLVDHVAPDPSDLVGEL